MRSETRARVGGRFAFGPILYLAGAPVSIASHLIFLEESILRAGPLLMASAIGYLAMGASWWLATATVFRNRGQVPIAVSWVVVFAVLSGALRSACSSWVAVSLGAEQPWGVWLNRTLSGALVAGVMVPVGTYLIASISDYRQCRETLISEQVMLRAARLESEAGGRALAHAVNAAANERVAAVFAPVLDSLAQSGRTGSDVARELREGPALAIRQVAHDMWHPAPAPSLPGSARDWLRVARVSDVALAPIVGIWLLSALTLQWTRAGWAWGTIAAFISAGVVAAGVGLGRGLAMRLARGAWIAFWLALVASATVGSILVSLVPGIGLNRMLLDFPVALMWLVLLTSTVAVVRGALARSSDVLVELSQNVDQERLQLAAADQLRVEFEHRTAHLIHAQIQGRIQGVITSLEQESPPDERWIRDQLAALRIEDSLDGAAGDIDSEVRSLVDAWGGFMTIEWSTNVRGSSDAMVRRVRQVAAEALTNAHRHGHASRVVLTVKWEGNAIRLVVADDGTGLDQATIGQPGMGSSVYALATGGRWELSNGVPRGCVLSALVDLD